MDLIGVCELILKMLGLPQIEVIDDDFCYYDIENNVIGVNYADMLKASEKFYDYAGQINNDARQFSIILWSFLHEVGHYNEQFEEENVIAELAGSDSLVRHMLQMLSDDNEDVQMAYFNLPREEYATRWAANFLKNNYEKCVEVNKICQQWERK